MRWNKLSDMARNAFRKKDFTTRLTEQGMQTAMTIYPIGFIDGFRAALETPRQKHRELTPGQTFYFFAGGETGELPPAHYDPADYVELNGGGYIIIHDAECYDPDYDRQKNFFFTKKEARQCLAKIRKLIQGAR